MSAIALLLLLGVGIIGGVIVTEVTGYVWHRFVEHKGTLGNKLREAHFHHHEVAYPVGTLRRPSPYIISDSWTWLLLAAAVSVVVLGISYAIGQVLGGIAVLIGGALYGRIVIVTLHKAFHTSGHPLDAFAWFRTLRLYHDLHHLRNGNYGIVFMTMDRVCGTFVRKAPRPPRAEDLFPGFPPALVARVRSRGLPLSSSRES